MSVTPAIGDSTSGGLISMSRILKGLVSLIKKPHEILPHVAYQTGAQASRLVYLIKVSKSRLRSNQFTNSQPTSRIVPRQARPGAAMHAAIVQDQKAIGLRPRRPWSTDPREPSHAD